MDKKEKKLEKDTVIFTIDDTEVETPIFTQEEIENGIIEKENVTITEIDDSRIIFNPEEWEELKKIAKEVAEEEKKKSDGSTT